MKIAAFVGITRIHLITLNRYRISAFSNVMAVMFYGFIQTSILIAFYRFGNSSGIAMTVRQAVSYAWLIQTIHVINPIFQDAELRGRIESGEFVYDLCRPIDLYTHWFARILAQRLAPIFLYLPAIFGITLLLPGVYRLLPPASIAATLSWIGAMAAAILMATSISCVLAAMQIRVERGRGLVAAISFIMSVLSGGEVPLPILSETFVIVLRWMPFAGMFDIPISLYLGLIESADALGFVARQLAWSAAFIIIGRAVLKRRLKDVIVQGG